MLTKMIVINKLALRSLLKFRNRKKGKRVKNGGFSANVFQMFSKCFPNVLHDGKLKENDCDCKV